MEAQAGMALQPGAYLGVLVGRVVVHDGVDCETLGHVSLDDVEEVDELLVPVPLHAAADDGALEHVERREQDGGAVPDVVVRHRAAAPSLHRQAGLGAVQRVKQHPSGTAACAMFRGKSHLGAYSH